MNNLFSQQVRSSDPATSHAWADRENTNNKGRNRRMLVLQYVLKYPGLTAAELGNKMFGDSQVQSHWEWPRKSMSKLEAEGLVFRKNVDNVALKWYPTLLAKEKYGGQ